MAKGAVIHGVSFDSVEENRAFAKKQGFPFTLLCDETRLIGMSYGACDTPDAEYARRISYIIGPDGKIAHAFPKVDPGRHPAEILQALG